MGAYAKAFPNIINVKDYGATGDGSTDDTTAITNALAAGASGSCVVYFPSGNYSVTSGFSSSAQGIHLKGDGGSAIGTRITCTSTTGDIFTLTGQNSGMEGFKFTYSGLPTAGYCIVLGSGCYRSFAIDIEIWYSFNGIKITDAAESIIDRIDIRNLVGTAGIYFTGTAGTGSYGGTFTRIITANPYPTSTPTAASVKTWATSTSFTAGNVILNNNNIYQCSTTGTSSSSGTGPSGVPGTTATNAFTTTITDGTAVWKFVSQSLVWFTMDNYAYSARIRGAAFTYGYKGVLLTDTAASGTSYPKFFHSTNLEIDHAYSQCFQAHDGLHATIINGWMGSSLSANGIALTNNFKAECCIDSTRVEGNAQYGIIVNTGQDVTIANNIVGDNSSQTANTYHGIVVAANVNGVSIVGNKSGDTADVAGNNQAYGIAVLAGTSANIRISDNILDGNTSGRLLIGALSGANNYIQGTTTSYQYMLPVASGAQTPVNGQTIYIGMIGRVGNTTASLMRVYMPIAGTVTKTLLEWSASGTAGSNENITATYRLNDTTDTAIQTVGNTNAIKTFTNSSMSVAVAAGDFYEVKMAFPTWATPPTGVVITGSVVIDVVNT